MQNTSQQGINTTVLIPAYTSGKQGIVLKLSLIAKPHHQLAISSFDITAQAFEYLFARTLKILSSLQPAFAQLNFYQFELHTLSEKCLVKDARSASLPFCIALCNLRLVLEGKKQLNNLLGTGILRMDGSIEATALEVIKEEASKAFDSSCHFINHQYCQHVFDLENIFNFNHIKELL